MNCPKCGQENLEFKVYCGSCGAQLREFPKEEESIDSEERVQGARSKIVKARPRARRIQNSRIFGIFFIFIPLLLIIFSSLIFDPLVKKGDLPPTFIIIAWLFGLFSISIIVGSFLFAKDWGWKFGQMEGPMRAAFALILCASMSMACFLGSVSLYNETSEYKYHDPIELSSDLGASTIGGFRFNSEHQPGISGDPRGMTISKILFYTASKPGAFAGIDFNGSASCRINDCVFFVGLKLTQCHDVEISNCVFQGSIILLFNCSNIDINRCSYSTSDLVHKDNNCSEIVSEFNTEYDNSELPAYSDFQLPFFLGFFEVVLVAIFVIWLFLFGWLRTVEIDEY